MEKSNHGVSPQTTPKEGKQQREGVVKRRIGVELSSGPKVGRKKERRGMVLIYFHLFSFELNFYNLFVLPHQQQNCS